MIGALGPEVNLLVVPTTRDASFSHQSLFRQGATSTPARARSAPRRQKPRDGRGIALARSSIAEGDLRAGKLVRLFSVAVPAASATYLVWPKGRLSANAVLFRDWLLEERQRES